MCRLSFFVLVFAQATVSLLIPELPSLASVARSSERGALMSSKVGHPRLVPPALMATRPSPRAPIITQAAPALRKQQFLSEMEIFKLNAREDSQKLVIDQGSPSAASHPLAKIWNDGKPFESLGNAMSERAAIGTGIHLEGELGNTLQRQIHLTGAMVAWLYNAANLKAAIQDVFSQGARDVLVVLCRARASEDAFLRNMGSAATEKIVFGNPKVNPLYALLYINIICASKQPIDFTPFLSQMSATLTGIAQQLHPAKIAQNIPKVPGHLRARILSLNPAEPLVDATRLAELKTADPIQKASTFLQKTWKARPKPVSQLANFMEKKVAMDIAEGILVDKLAFLPDQLKPPLKRWLTGTHVNLFKSICLGKASSNEYIRVFTNMVVKVIATNDPRTSPRLFTDYIQSLCAAKKVKFM